MYDQYSSIITIMYSTPDYQDYDIIGEKDYELNQNFLENQRNLISTHVYQITELLSEVFGNYWEMFMRKVSCFSYQVFMIRSSTGSCGLGVLTLEGKRRLP